MQKVNNNKSQGKESRRARQTKISPKLSRKSNWLKVFENNSDLRYSF